LPSALSTKLPVNSTAMKTGDMWAAKVAQIVLDSGNDKLNAEYSHEAVTCS